MLNVNINSCLRVVGACSTIRTNKLSKKRDLNTTVPRFLNERPCDMCLV